MAKRNLAVKCPKCGKWRHQETKWIETAVLECFSCGFKRRIKNNKGEYLVETKDLPFGKEKTVVSELNRLEEKKE